MSEGWVLLKPMSREPYKEHSGCGMPQSWSLRRYMLWEANGQVKKFKTYRTISPQDGYREQERWKGYKPASRNCWMTGASFDHRTPRWGELGYYAPQNEGDSPKPAIIEARKDQPLQEGKIKKSMKSTRNALEEKDLFLSIDQWSSAVFQLPKNWRFLKCSAMMLQALKRRLKVWMKVSIQQEAL